MKWGNKIDGTHLEPIADWDYMPVLRGWAEIRGKVYFL